MKAVLLLADAARTAEGKLYILGGGWSVTGPGPVSMALAVKLEVPWAQANRQHHIRLALFDADGSPAPEEHPLVVDAEIEVGRPAGLLPGTPLDVPLAVPLAPIHDLRPGGRYEWVLTINGETNEYWRAAFQVRQG